MLEGGTIPGSAIGLDSGTSDADFALATQMNRGTGFQQRNLPGWLTHWGKNGQNLYK